MFLVSHRKLWLLRVCISEITSRLTIICTMLHNVSSLSLPHALDYPSSFPWCCRISHDTPPTLRLTSGGKLFLQKSPRPFIPHTHILQYSTLPYLLGRSRICLLHVRTITESMDGEDQQGPKQDHDANDGGAPSNKHLWRGIYIRFNYIMYRRQVVNDGATLPLFIQPARVAGSPDDVH